MRQKKYEIQLGKIIFQSFFIHNSISFKEIVVLIKLKNIKYFAKYIQANIFFGGEGDYELEQNTLLIFVDPLFCQLSKYLNYKNS